jgi:hypothetical protein
MQYSLKEENGSPFMTSDGKITVEDRAAFEAAHQALLSTEADVPLEPSITPEMFDSAQIRITPETVIRIYPLLL